jgi:nicotinamidase-related amidase
MRHKPIDLNELRNMTDKPVRQISRKVVDGPLPRSDTALLLIDVVTDFDFEDGAKLWQNARAIIRPLRDLKAAARSMGAPVIYVNDNFGNWQEDLERQVDRIMNNSAMGREFISRIRPDAADFYVLKPQRSGFYETPLSVLLSSLKIRNVIIAGLATDICILFTAHDAYMRGFGVKVPSDCTAAVDDSYKTSALELISRVAGADTCPSGQLEFNNGSGEEEQKN